MAETKVFLARGFRLWESTDGGSSWERLPPLPVAPLWQLAGGSRWLRRMLRVDEHHWQVLPSGRHVVIVAGAIYRGRTTEPWVCSALLTDHRPLALAQTLDGGLYFGEYRRNPERSPIAIWQSHDEGVTWNPVWTFQGVRHVHGVFNDPYTGALWVTTGDTDTESGTWVTEDGFKSLEKLIGGNQQTRAVQLLFTKTHVYFGSDAPREKNFIYRMERKSGRVERLQEVEGPVFWGCKVGEHLFFSTVVEPTSISLTKHACIWGSKDGESWRKVADFRKDFWPMRLFQYGQIRFPTGENNTGYLFFTPVATEKHGTIQRLKVTDIFGD